MSAVSRLFRPGLRMFEVAQWRLVAWNALILILILAILEVAVYSQFSENIYSEVDQQLKAQKARVLERLAQAGGDPYSLYALPNSPFEPAYRTVVANSAGQVNVSTDCPPTEPMSPQRSCPAGAMQPVSRDAMLGALSKGTDDLRTVSFRDNGPQRVLTFAVSRRDIAFPSVIQISRSAAGEDAGIRELLALLILGGILGVILSGLAGLFLANRALVPIRRAFSAQKQFTADASHELRTPLALIRANAEMLERHADRLPEGDHELVGEIVQETDHLNHLVSDLLTLARADVESLKLASKPVDLRALVQDVHEDLQRIAEARGIDSEASLNGPTTVQGDPERLRQLLLILMDNALKYTDPGGRVDLSLERHDSRVILTITDTGIGIPRKDIPRVFDRFYRVDRAREHESGGTGLGLAIAQWIVQAHHGSIKVESDSGRGTRFQIDLPASN